MRLAPLAVLAALAAASACPPDTGDNDDDAGEGEGEGDGEGEGGEGEEGTPCADVLAVEPPDGAVDVSLVGAVRVTFPDLEARDAASLTLSTPTVADVSNLTVHSDGLDLVALPLVAPWDADTRHVLTIDRGACLQTSELTTEAVTLAPERRLSLRLDGAVTTVPAGVADFLQLTPQSWAVDATAGGALAILGLDNGGTQDVCGPTATALFSELGAGFIFGTETGVPVSPWGAIQLETLIAVGVARATGSVVTLHVLQDLRLAAYSVDAGCTDGAAEFPQCAIDAMCPLMASVGAPCVPCRSDDVEVCIFWSAVEVVAAAGPALSESSIDVACAAGCYDNNPNSICN